MFSFGARKTAAQAIQQRSNTVQLTTIREGSNRARRGLYDGKDVRTGNNVSFSMKATKRTFKPNVHKKRLYSEILDEMIRFHVTTSTLRSIDKAGGLDNYIMRNDFQMGEGYAVKKRILQKLKELEKAEARAEKKKSEEASATTV